LEKPLLTPHVVKITLLFGQTVLGGLQDETAKNNVTFLNLLGQWKGRASGKRRTEKKEMEKNGP